MTTTIRPATPEDVGQILTFIRGLAEFEHASDQVQATEEDLLRDGFGPNPSFFCLIADHDNVPAGFALCFHTYSTWTGRPGIHLEDLYVEPKFRGIGIGKALLCRVAAVAAQQKCGRLEWSVLDWNTPAIDFYRSLGAEFLHEWRNMRVSGDAIQKVAANSPILS